MLKKLFQKDENMILILRDMLLFKTILSSDYFERT